MNGRVVGRVDVLLLMYNNVVEGLLWAYCRCRVVVGVSLLWAYRSCGTAVDVRCLFVTGSWSSCSHSASLETINIQGYAKIIGQNPAPQLV